MSHFKRAGGQCALFGGFGSRRHTRNGPIGPIYIGEQKFHEFAGYIFLHLTDIPVQIQIFRTLNQKSLDIHLKFDVHEGILKKKIESSKS